MSSRTMTKLQTPQELIAARVAAFRRADFSFIYDSYLAQAPFRHFFPARDEYVTYAAEQIQGELRIEDFSVIRCQTRGGHADLLLLQVIVCAGERREVLELCRLEQIEPDGWLYHSGLKLDAKLLPEDLQSVSWNQLEAAGDGVWI